MNNAHAYTCTCAQGVAPFRVADVADAVAEADVVILATPGSHDDDGIKALAASLGGDCAGKVVIDSTNPLSSFPTGLQVRWSQGTSAGEVRTNPSPSPTMTLRQLILLTTHQQAPVKCESTGCAL